MISTQQALPTIPCTYNGCLRTFNTLADMRAHKVKEPDHFYCKKCDIDCESWDDLTQHKIDLMAPFLEGRMKGKGEHPKHITCEFCGEDFKSFGGRKRHRDSAHKAQQPVTCPGCATIFVRASYMLDHLELNQCSQISAYDFRVNIQKKHIMAEVLENPDALIDNFHRLARPATTSSQPATIGNSAAASDSDDEDGGVGLFDSDGKSSNSTVHVPQTRQNLETWPRLPGLGPGPESLTRSLEQVSLTASNKSISELELPPGHFTAKSGQQSKEVNLVKTTASGPSNVWDQLQGTRALFPQTEQKAPHTEALAVAERAEMDVEQPANFFNLDSCNFFSNDFDSERFFDRTIDRYICPFSACREIRFETPELLKTHFEYGHTKLRFPCPACLKVFRKPSALVCHIETTTKCKIQQADQFQKLVDDLSGGFLKAKALPQAAIYRPSTDLVRAGRPIDGVVTAKFKGKLPDTFKDPSW